jgi:methylthioribose-1-phosphate isomerase
MARWLWPGQDPIGQRLVVGFFPDKVWEVVGIVKDVKERGLAKEGTASLYMPYAQNTPPNGTLVIRTRTSQPGALASAVVAAVHEIDRDQPVTDVMPMQTIVERSTSDTRFTMLLLAAFAGLALGARVLKAGDPGKDFERLCRLFAGTRPTAVNLFWAIERMRRVFARNQHRPLDTLRMLLEREATAIHDEDVAINRRLGAHGAALIEDGATVLTHCNAGALATAGYGTALGVIRAAREAGKRIQVIACETRPFLQGARLTAWELVHDGIDTTVITDNMAATFMRQGLIDFIVVGADRIAAKGDVANKVGTYGVAVLAHEHGIPFYVAAPSSTIDLATPDGSGIPIEERPIREVTHVGPTRITPEQAKIRNPAFDVTPSRYVTGIITERGVFNAPYQESLPQAVR